MMPDDRAARAPEPARAGTICGKYPSRRDEANAARAVTGASHGPARVPKPESGAWLGLPRRLPVSGQTNGVDLVQTTSSSYYIQDGAGGINFGPYRTDMRAQTQYCGM